MSGLSNLGIILGTSWTSGVNLYLTLAGLGIASRMNWVSLPGELNSLSNPIVIGLAVLMYLVEFFADKIPYIDSTWDSIHTAIRPIGGAALAYMATSNAGPALQIPTALLSGSIAMESHLAKASSRAAINTSPEPISNSVASLTEDGLVAGLLYLIIKHPVIASVIAILLIILSFWLLKTFFKFAKRIFSRKRETGK